MDLAPDGRILTMRPLIQCGRCSAALNSRVYNWVSVTHTVLVIDDDESLRDTIGLMLENEGFKPILVADGATGLEQAFVLKPALILVDLRMPGLSGVEVCKRLRAAGSKIPVIVLSAVGDEVDKVLLLEIGADDYVVKPFGARELLARIRALLRRTTQGLETVLSFSNVDVDLDQRVVRRNGGEIKLTRAEFNLLAFFLQNPTRALTRDVILNSVWGYESFPNTRTVDAHVVRLRQKLEPDPEVPRHFLTLHGVGYRFQP
jgi:DNA-binding response OmpR family regulator